MARRIRLKIETLDDRRLLSASTESDWSDSSIRYDDGGRAFVADPLPPLTAGAAADLATGPVPTSPSVPLSDLPFLHSRPTSNKKIYLDFNGQSVSGTSWNASFGGKTIHAAPYDIDGDINSWSDEELNRIHRIWERVSEDYAPFDVDVTTEEPNLSTFTSGRRGIRVIITTRQDDARLGGTGTDWYAIAGGVAYINSWNWQSDTPAWVFHNEIGSGDKNVAEAASHETGHTLGLSHDGQGTEEYYAGHGTGATDWAPIMGVGYSKDVTQWSRGEYTGATNTEDDLATIAAKINYRPDDHGNTATASATPLNVAAGSFTTSGLIERNTDVDFFQFDVGLAQGVLNLQANSAPLGANLDILLKLYDGNHQLIAQSNPLEQLNANLGTPVGPGVYYVSVEGTGKLPVDSGYSNYGSLGQFTISGTLQLNPPNYVPGDLNGDKVVDAADASLLFSNWGSLPSILPGPAPVGKAIASYNRWTGEVIISGNGINSWFIESPSAGFTGDPLPATVPIHGGVVTDKPERVGELAFSTFSFTNLNLGRIAQPGLNDVAILFSAGISSPVQPGQMVLEYTPGAAAAETASAVYNAVSGDVVVSAANVVRWYISSPSGGLVGAQPASLPAANGTVEETSQVIGETADTSFTVTNLPLGPVATLRLPDVQIFYQISTDSPLIEGTIMAIGLGDDNLDGIIDAGDAATMFANWSG